MCNRFRPFILGTLAVLLALLVVSCHSLTAPPGRDFPEVPRAYLSAPDGVPVPEEWWRAFNDEQLDRLMSRALGGNLSIEQASARLRQAEAVAVRSGAARFPQLSGNAAAGTRKVSSDRQGSVTTDSYSLGLAARYELDLWGRVASGRRSALHAMEASRLDRETAAMSVAAETADLYFLWQQLQLRLDILKNQLESGYTMLSVVEKRFESGQADALDVLQQRQRTTASETALPPVEAAVRSVEYALAVLTGEPPQTDLQLEVKPLPVLPPVPEAGLPSGLLIRRPDLQAAWERLAALDWNVSEARADRLPALTLTGSAAYEADHVNRLFENWAANLAAGLTAPLIDGGFRRAEVVRARAAADEQVASYRQFVLEALAEVEDALTAEHYQQLFYDALLRQWTSSILTAEEAFRRYTRGLESYFEALSAETLRQGLEVSVLQTKYDLIAGRVRLYRVLGGDWGTVLETHRPVSDSN